MTPAGGNEVLCLTMTDVSTLCSSVGGCPLGRKNSCISRHTTVVSSVHKGGTSYQQVVRISIETYHRPQPCLAGSSGLCFEIVWLSLGSLALLFADNLRQGEGYDYHRGMQCLNVGGCIVFGSIARVLNSCFSIIVHPIHCHRHCLLSPSSVATHIRGLRYVPCTFIAIIWFQHFLPSSTPRRGVHTHPIVSALDPMDSRNSNSMWHQSELLLRFILRGVTTAGRTTPSPGSRAYCMSGITTRENNPQKRAKPIK